MKSGSLIVLFLILFAGGAAAQDPPFYKDIQNFKRMDSAAMPPKGAIVFTGSSSFTGWKDVQQRFPDYTIINRGFGGSSLPHVIMYADDVIFKYEPKQVVIYCGENDAAAGAQVTADTITNRFITLFNLIRGRLPDTDIAFVSMKPSPSRVKFRDVITKANDRIKTFLEQHPKTAYIDVYSKMLDTNGAPIGTLFQSDSLHMTRPGYDIWTEAIGPYLKK
ncbi:MAG: G-D-S-L family lipolytic protein [Chitinophagaceae bacterium]|nr:MAG: G-D-S-L family lipolytic protein [Chitinophagaceae bacterium]